MFRAKKGLDKRFINDTNLSIKYMSDKIRSLEDRLELMSIENYKLNYIVNNPPRYKVGDVLNDEVVVKVELLSVPPTGCNYGWHYTWVEIKKVKV